MSEIVLPRDRFSGEKHVTALENLVNRYHSEQEPIHYKKAAIGMNDTTCSSCLRFFCELGLIRAEKQGIYVPNDSVVNYFRKVGDAEKRGLKEIKSTLENYPIFSEAQFLLGTAELDKEKLSVEIASQKGIDKEEISKVERAIGIFLEFDLFRLDGNGSIEESTIGGINDQSKSFQFNQESENSGEESEEEDTEHNYLNKEDNNSEKSETKNLISDVVEDFGTPPYRTGPEKLLTVCQVMSKGGEWTRDSIIDETDLPANSGRRTIEYGKQIGVLSESEEGLELTPEGFDLGYEDGFSDTTERIFRKGLSQSKEYSALIVRIHNTHGEEISSNHQVGRDTILREMRVHFGLTDPSEDTLQRATATFFETLEAAGCGKYIIGRGSKSTRLELDTGDIPRLKEIKTEVANSVTQTISSESVVLKQKDKSEKEKNNEDTNNSGTESVQERGPPLRISTVRIQNYRNLQDTGEVSLENITILIGENESGKTSTLEAINSFDDNDDGEYRNRDLCNDIEIGEKSNTPIVSLKFKINRSIAKSFYPEIADSLSNHLPIEVEVTKFADGSRELTAEPELLQEYDYDLPSPNILYYKDYDIISDEVYLDEVDNNESGYRTFQNLMDVGGLEPRTILEKEGLERDRAITRAEDQIENELNRVWSQKNIEISLRYNEIEETLRLYLQDEFEDGERGLTQPSQRSEGFRWFFSFYINLISETKTDGDGYKILLLDDPAVHLHPEGKQDWLQTVEEVGQNEQVIYSSHSPYLIQKRYPSRIRTVEDHGKSGTRIGADIFDAEAGTLEPLRNALGVNLGSSPFVSQRQVIVEGPTEYYLLSAVANYFKDALERDIFEWGEIAIMPVRGAPDVIGKASWLESEQIEYAILLDSDEEGKGVDERISTHHADIDEDRVVLLEKGNHLSDIVIEDMFTPEFYVQFVNEEYEDYTSDFDSSFGPIQVEAIEEGEWLIDGLEYDGTRLDTVLESVLQERDISNQLENDEGEIELRKRQIAERIANHVNSKVVDEEIFKHFNRLFARLNDASDRSHD